MAKHDKKKQGETAEVEIVGTDKPKLKRKEYGKELLKLQTELCLLQDWVKHTGERIMSRYGSRSVQKCFSLVNPR
mgnify:CR=1 FL=1